VRREIVLLSVLVAAASGGFALTRAVAVSNRAMHERDAAEWFARAEAAAAAGDAVGAATALRRAVSTDPSRTGYRLALARTLASGGESAEARQVLLALRDTDPGHPETNLQLARLDAREGRLDDALRYYQDALTALWSADRLDERRAARIELIELLLQHDQRSRALSELLVLGANLPETPDAQIDAGFMFLRAGEPRRAEDYFARALKQRPKDPRGLAGAGEAAFEQGDFTLARRLLAAAPGDDPRVAELRAVTDFVLTGDPLAPRLGLQERRRRFETAFAHAAETFRACAARPAGGRQPTGADVQALLADVEAFERSRAARRPPPLSRDAIEDGFDLVARIARAADQACQARAPFDRAIRLIARRHGLDES
jgi:tetratricopeptide (TPR) repeat protein